MLGEVHECDLSYISKVIFPLQELEQAHLKNEEMQAKFIQEGKELLQRNRESLAAEMDNASKDEVRQQRWTV